MLLGLSNEKKGLAANYEAVNGSVDNAAAGSSTAADGATNNIAFADLLTGLADAIYEREPAGLAAAKSELVRAVGEEVLVDAVAVAANFFMMTRIADGTGTPLDASTTEMSEAAREIVGVNEFVSRR